MYMKCISNTFYTLHTYINIYITSELNVQLFWTFKKHWFLHDFQKNIGFLNVRFFVIEIHLFLITGFSMIKINDSRHAI